jgi:hypothetical protein
MGQQAHCKILIGKKVAEGKAMLESNELIFRGSEVQLKIPFRQMTSIAASDGWLSVQSSHGAAAFALGAQAAKWADKIRNPKSLMDKLGVKAGMRASVLGTADAGFRRELASRLSDISDGNVGKDSDLIFLGAEQDEALDRLRDISRALKPNGGIWVVYPKGQKQITEGGVLAAGKRAGLVDVKVASFSATHTALKFVIPLKKRQLR